MTWVLVTDTHPRGEIAGFLQDNGSYEKGWLLGYGNRGFSFILSTTGADDGDGALTRINSRAQLEVGRWHHVAATYDGTTMRLFVDGREDVTSTAQSGDILYPERGRYAIGAYVDDNEFHPMDGG